jgi:hypothetical protein
MDLDELLTPSILVPFAAVVVVLAGIAIGVLTIRASRRGGKAVARWAHAAYSLWTGGEDSADWAADRAQNALRNWYGAVSGGQTQQVIAEVRAGQTGNAAWDKVRALDMLRIALAAGYVDAEQCRAQSAGIGKELQGRYAGWEALAQDFEAGMLRWQRTTGITDPSENGRVQRNLPKLRSQIWPAIAYGTPLTEE